MLKKLVKKDKSLAKSIDWGTQSTIPTIAHTSLKFDLENLNEFTHKEWKKYFIFKFEECGNRYVNVNNATQNAKNKSILTSLANNFTPQEIKLIIDFIFESDQDIMEKRLVTISVLSSGWINTFYQNSLLWQEGKFSPKNKKSKPSTISRKYFSDDLKGESNIIF